MKTKLLLTAVLLTSSFFSIAQIIEVPADQPTIQAGINAANDGDTVLVAEGIYFENIRFKGKAIYVASEFLISGEESNIENTIIDGSTPSHPDSASAIMFINFEDTTSILCGFTIQGGTGLNNSEDGLIFGGGIACRESGAKIINNIIKENTLSDPSLNCGGAGIGNYSETGYFWIVIENNLINENECSANAEYARGGGIYAMTNVVIRNNIIENNYVYNSGTQSDGAGIEVEQPLGTSITASIHSNIIQYNTAEGNYVYGGGIMVYQAEARVSNNTILFNTVMATEQAYGAGMYFLQSGGEIQILNNEIKNNESSGYLAYGGGFYFTEPNGSILIHSNSIQYNSCLGEYGSAGAAIGINTPDDKIEISNNEISNNSASGNEWSFGGILLSHAEDLEVIVDGNIFNNNTAMHVGGFYSWNVYNLKISNNLFFNNEVEKWGGAIFMNQYYANDKDEKVLFNKSNPHSPKKNLQKGKSEFRPLIINNTFFGNQAGEMGGAIYTTSNYDSLCPVILNNIFWNNSAGTFGNDIRHGGDETINVGYNDIDPNGIWGNWTGEDNIFEDPLLVDPANGDFHLDKNSPCAGKGIDSLEGNETMYFCPSIDFEDDPRPMPYTLKPDMGADEVDETTEIPKTKIPNSNLRLTNYPNPFSSGTTIEFTLLKSGFVSLSVYDLQGEIYEKIAFQKLTSGNHQFEWNATDVPNGIYFLRLEINGVSETRKLILLK